MVHIKKLYNQTLMIIQLPWDILLAAKFASGHFFSDEILMPSLCKS